MRQLGMKLLTLLCAFGVPFWAADQLQPALERPWAFAVGFAPVGLVLHGAYYLDEATAGWPRLCVRAGLVGAGLLVVGSGVMACQLLGWPPGRQLVEPRPATLPWWLQAAGLLVGVAASAAYMRAARRFLAARRGGLMRG